MKVGRDTMVTFSLTFVRHGETLYNRKSIIQGQLDVPLSTVGEKQAELVAERLQNDRFSHIFASDLTRAYDTAKTIARANKVCRCDITIDKRLRERKFGVAEGKSSKELMVSVKKSKRRYIDYTPPGAESVTQVQERVQTFFKDICKLCVDQAAQEENPYPPGKIKRRHGGSLGRNSGPNKRLEISRRSQSFCGAGSIQNFINEINIGPDFENEDSDINDNDINFCKRSNCLIEENENTDKMMDSYNYREYVPSSSDDSNFSCDLKSMSSSDNSIVSDGDDLSPNESENASTIIMQVGRETEQREEIVHKESNTRCSQSACDECNSVIHRKSKRQATIEELGFPECPNVSLSPTMPHRLPSISSISSGRNSSFDDLDSVPINTADILIVSHGGYIKETMRYFVERLDCKVPGMKGHAYKVCPNCSVSKFVISLDKSGTPSITCITIHDKDHLISLDISEAKGAY